MTNRRKFGRVFIVQHTCPDGQVVTIRPALSSRSAAEAVRDAMALSIANAHGHGFQIVQVA